MAGMGPPPKPADQRRRKNRSAPNLTQLPSEGRQGDVPAWPLPDPREAELEVWAELWVSPQATMWERLGWTRAVARYTRTLVDAEVTGAPITLLGEVRQMEDRLGLTPMSMLRLRWEVVTDELEDKRQAPPSKARERFKLVDADAVARA